MIQVDVFGDRRFQATMRQAGLDVTRLNDTHKEAAEVAAVAGRASAPVRSGKLSGSIRTGATRKAGIIRAGKKSVPYALPIHWGWPKRNIAANPWLSEAAQATEPAWLRVYEQRVNEIINEIEGV